jgi:glycosyltransferase involved in cell wall biosynthesis
VPDRRPASVSAVLPAYNEVAVIGDVVRRTHAALSAAGLEGFEVIVVDDGSADGTGDAVRALQADLSGVRLLAHDQNRGYGAALRSGFDAARCEATWLLDSDAQFDPADITLLLDAWQPRTMVAGYRAHRSDSLVRRLNHAAFFALVRVLHGRTTRDVNCAFKLFPRETGAGLHAEGAVISTELLLRARAAGLKVAEVAIPHYPRTAGTPTGANLRVVLRAFAELPRLRRMVASPQRTVDGSGATAHGAGGQRGDGQGEPESAASLSAEPAP